MYKTILIILLFLTLLSADAEWIKIVDLRGQWKFNLGDNLNWADPDYDDSDWENIFVPAPWEDEGFPGYDGYAWYRTSFNISSEYMSQNLYIRLWQIDDVDEVYINGHFVGFSGSFPPNYYTAYTSDRIYHIPEEYLRFDSKNIITVRVFDKELFGGIMRGRIGIYTRRDEIEPDIPLDGSWKFMIGDNPRWKEYDYNDRQWKKIMVPAHWETQGYKDYDGYAWYRTQVFIADKFRDERLILVLGKIDDVDEVYFNGILVGATGSIPGSGYHSFSGEEWLEWRAYTLDRDDINYNAKNVIAVRVYDAMIHGGIYQGPIGIMTRENYNNWRNRAGEKRKSFFESLFGD